MTRFGAWALCVVMLVMLGAPPARAQEEPPQPDQREVSARQLFAVGKYAEALELYSKLFAETGHPTYQRNIGRCYQNLGEADKAISSFREYLRQAKGLAAEQRTTVEGYIAEMEELKKKQEAERAKNEPPPGATVVSTPANDTHPAAHRSRLPAYIVGGAGVAALGAGAYFGLRALSEKHAADPYCSADQCMTSDAAMKNEAAVRDALITDIALGVGAVTVGIATYLFFTSSGGDTVQPAPSSAWRISPVLAPGLAKVSAEARW